MAWAIKQKAGNATGKAVLLMLANYADEDGVCFPSQNTLANECECSTRAISNWLKRFEEAGLIARETRYGQLGYRTSDVIRLSIKSLPERGSRENYSPENRSEPTGTTCRAITYHLTNHLTYQMIDAREKNFSKRNFMKPSGLPFRTRSANPKH